RLVFPSDRTITVNIVYQISILTFIVNLIRLPYNALILAREKLHVYAVISIIEATLQLVIVYFLFLSNDKLVLYSVLTLVVSILVQLIYVWYCQKNFNETKLHIAKERKLLIELLSFSGWNLIGNIAAVARNQGINLVISVFYGVTVNAVYAISIQVQNAVG